MVRLVVIVVLCGGCHALMPLEQWSGGEPDQGPTDVGPVDVVAVDTAAVDAAAFDRSVADGAAMDTAAMDTATVDTAAVDSSVVDGAGEGLVALDTGGDDAPPPDVIASPDQVLFPDGPISQCLAGYHQCGTDCCHSGLNEPGCSALNKCIPKVCNDMDLALHVPFADATKPPLNIVDGQVTSTPVSGINPFDPATGMPPPSYPQNSTTTGLDFDGKYFTPPQQIVTVLMWVHADLWNVGGTDNWPLFVVQYPNGSAVNLDFDQSAQQFVLRLLGNTPYSNGNCTRAHPTKPAKNTWYLVGFAIDPLKVRTYGPGPANHGNTCGPGLAAPTPIQLTFGGPPTAATVFDGRIDGLMIFNRVLISQEIDNLRLHGGCNQ